MAKHILSELMLNEDPSAPCTKSYTTPTHLNFNIYYYPYTRLTIKIPGIYRLYKEIKRIM